MMKKKSVLFLILFAAISMQYCFRPSENAQNTSGITDWDRMLRLYVNEEGVVNYSEWKNEVDNMKALLDYLGDSRPPEDAPRARQMAYWINLYNAATVYKILDNYPLKSIMELDGGKVWDRKWIKVGGDNLSLNQIEHDILRPKFKDARIHFAVNCAAKSCPPLLNRAWKASNLDKTLDERTRSFVNNSKHNNITPQAVKISKIFEWYKQDFGALIPFLNKYSQVKISDNAQVSYLPYNWELNGH